MKVCRWRSQRGASLLELLLASGLVTLLILTAATAESAFSRQRLEAVNSLEAITELERAMEPILREIRLASEDPRSGAPLITLPPATGGCAASLTITSGADQVRWALEGGQLVRRMNGVAGPPLGSFTDLCFTWDTNGHTVLVTLQKRDAGGGLRTLRSGATPWGGL